MSFYAGPSLCHITNNQKTIEELRATTIYEDTVFNSTINYITYETFTLTKSGNPSVLTSDGVYCTGGSGTDQYKACTAYLLPQEAIDKLVEGYAYVLLSSPMSTSMTADIGAWSGYYSYAGNLYISFGPGSETSNGNAFSMFRYFFSSPSGNHSWNNVPGEPSNAYPYLGIRGDQGHDNITLVVMNFKYDGTIDPLPRSGTSTLINKNSLVLNGVDIRRLKFISTIPINNYNYGFSLTYPSLSAQLVNSSTYGELGSMDLTSTNGIDIKVGGVSVLSSSISPIGMRVKSKGTILYPGGSPSRDGNYLLMTLPTPTTDEMCYLTFKIKGGIQSATYLGAIDGTYSMLYNSNISINLNTPQIPMIVRSANDYCGPYGNIEYFFIAFYLLWNKNTNTFELRFQRQVYDMNSVNIPPIEAHYVIVG